MVEDISNVQKEAFAQAVEPRTRANSKRLFDFCAETGSVKFRTGIVRLKTRLNQV